MSLSAGAYNTKRWLVAFVGVFALYHPALQAREATITIEQAIGTPFPAGLVAAPSGGTVAWVFNDYGARNVWMAAASGARARQVTAFTGDDGYDVGELAWSPDATRIAFTRGGTLEDDAPSNIDSRPEGPMPREVWMTPLSGGPARKVGVGHNAAFSSDSRWLVFADKHQILGVDLRESQAPQTLMTDMGTIGAMRWSPDGRRLAFTSERGAHVLIGILDLASRRITWLAPGLDGDTDPVFSPDGTRVAFIRVPYGQRRRSVDRRVGTPWSIWVVDAATGTGRRAWVADAGQGSVYRATLSEQNLLWTADDTLVFPWEKTGWLLPYAVDARGGTPRALVKGAFEVADLTLGEDGRRVMMSTNQDDIDRLHIWAVDTKGGRAQRLTQGKTIEAYPEVASDGTIVALLSDAVTPLYPAALVGGAWKPLVPEKAAPATLTAQMVVPQSVTFKAKDGLDVYAQLFLPTGGKPGPHPAIMFFHGGPSRQMLAGYHYMGAYSWMYGVNQYWAAHGYVVLAVNYRGGIGYGLDYREAKNFGANGASEVNDLQGAVTYLRGRSDVDARHVGIWGGSYGGLMTAYGLARAPDAFAAGVDYAGVYDYALSPSFQSLTGDPAAVQRAIESSPKSTVDQWRTPVLVVTSDDDRNVPYIQSSALVADLRKRGVENEVLVIPNEVHDLTKFSSWMTLFTATDAFLGRFLKKQ